MGGKTPLYIWTNQRNVYMRHNWIEFFSPTDTQWGRWILPRISSFIKFTDPILCYLTTLLWLLEPLDLLTRCVSGQYISFLPPLRSSREIIFLPLRWTKTPFIIVFFTQLFEIKRNCTYCVFVILFFSFQIYHWVFLDFERFKHS